MSRARRRAAPDSLLGTPLTQTMRLLAASLLALAAACSSPDSEPGRSGVSSEAIAREGLNDVFLAEDMDVDRFVRLFEGESREVYAQREGIADALGLRPKMAVADVGAGTGAFLSALAARVGPRGTVYAVDLSPGFIEHLEERIASERLAQVEVVQCTERSVELAPGSVDLVFTCDTYHHFEYPGSTLASIRRALRPGGRLVIVDFERIPALSRPWVLQHVRTGKEQVIEEVEAAGFTFESEPRVAGLQETYVAIFSR